MVIWPFYVSLDEVDSIPCIVGGATSRMGGSTSIFTDERLLEWDMKTNYLPMNHELLM